MLSVTITEKDGPSSVQTFDSTKSEVLIGRIKGNDIVLGRSNISKRHSRIVVKDGKIIVIDLKSTNGTFVNGEKITGPRVMEEGDKIFIGDFTIEVRETGGGAAVGSSVHRRCNRFRVVRVRHRFRRLEALSRNTWRGQR